MLFHLAAIAVLLVHLAFILFLLFGAVLVVKWNWLAVFQLSAAAWGIFIVLAGRVCPLTTWENNLLAMAGEARYSGGFIEHYLLKIIYPGDLTQDIRFTLAALVVAVNAGIYGWLCFLKLRRGRRLGGPQ